MIYVSPKERTMILDIIKTHAPDCEVRVFGSRYKGNNRPYSDIDLVFVGNEELNVSRIGDIRESFEESNLPYRVDVLDWNATSEKFREVINRGYEVIYKPE
ncbi:hypothetical protein AGMMS50276_03890 [Synergistales bacterium]|nr:hypothetical protein AGMMS50276_03890 [Synergistales bacterium]